MVNIKKVLKSIEKLDSEQRQKQISELIKEVEIKQMKAILPLLREDDTELVEGVINRLAGHLDDSKIGVRKSAVTMIAKYKTPSAKEALIKALDDVDYRIRKIAIQELVIYHDADLLETFIQALGDTYYEVKECAAKALGDFGNADAVMPLTKLAGDQYKAGAAAAQALGKLKDKRALQPLYEALEKFNPNNEHIIVAMGQIGAGEYIDKLSARLETPMTMSEYTAIQLALAMTKDPAVIPCLVSCLAKATAAPLFEFTIRCLGITQCIEAARPILDATTKGNYPQSVINSGAIPKIEATAVEALLSLPEIETLKIIVQEMKYMSFYDICERYIINLTDPAAIGLLNSLVDHKKKRIRNAAQQAMLNINS